MGPVLAAVVLLACLPYQATDPIPPTVFDEVIELELTAEAPTAMAEYFVDFEGTLHVWTRSELDLALEIEDVDHGEVVASDDDSGGGATPYVKLEVELNDELAITVAGGAEGALGAFELHFVAAPETDATLDAARAVRKGLVDVRTRWQRGEADAARARLDETLAILSSVDGAVHSDSVAAAVWDLGPVTGQVGDIAAARIVCGAVSAHRERTLPADHPDLLVARQNLATTLHASGDLAGARRLLEAVLEAYERTRPEDHPELLAVRHNLSNTLYSLGDLAGASRLQEAVLEACERTLPEGHPNLLLARGTLAGTLHTMGDLASARRLRAAVLEAYERTLPEDHPRLLGARGNLALTLQEQGDLAGARKLLEAVLESYERTLPENHPDLLRARGNLASLLSVQGDLAGARELRENLLEALGHTLPRDHPDLLGARHNLAATLQGQGDLTGARELQEAVLRASERTLAEDHPDLLLSRENLANTLDSLGDSVGARALRESVLEARERTLPEGHPALLRARLHLANTLAEFGDPAGATGLLEGVLEAHERRLPEDHPELLAVRGSLALRLKEQGDLAGARRLQEAVLEALERTMPAHHHDLLTARFNLALSLRESGDLAGALAIVEPVLEAHERTLPQDHPFVLDARQLRATTLYELGGLPDVREFVSDQVAGARRRSLASLAFAPREAREVVRGESARLGQLLFLTRFADSESQTSVFELQETLRVVALEAARALRSSSDPDAIALLDEARSVRAALGDLVARTDEYDEESLSEEFTRLVQKRDRVERRASQTLAEEGVLARPVEVEAFGDALRADAATVAYRRVPHYREDEETNRLTTGGDHLLAHVLRSDRSLVRIDLGDVSELEDLATAWRLAIGAPLARDGRVASGVDDDERRLGAKLREHLLDPVLAELGPETKRLHVCADDLVFLVPLDALPYEDRRVGDRWTMVNEVSYARLMVPSRPLGAESSLFVLGGVDYDAGAAGPIESAAGASRAAIPGTFERLEHTRSEVEAAARLFEVLCETAPVIVTGARATKDTFLEHAAGKRYVHLATHGWFATEAIRSTEDGDYGSGGGWTRTSAQELVTGMAPMLLCGLALAGANRGRDSLGRLNGILTAEELCALDLTACELAVLSACETNVGIRRAGQGIQSLQAALYAAGARSSITSLWRVHDASTKRLMERFYTNLWKAKMSKHQALWEAKRALRDERFPVRDWAGWVLTGDPD